jgi:hypothetical protein
MNSSFGELFFTDLALSHQTMFQHFKCYLGKDQTCFIIIMCYILPLYTNLKMHILKQRVLDLILHQSSS